MKTVLHIFLFLVSCSNLASASLTAVFAGFLNNFMLRNRREQYYYCSMTERLTRVPRVPKVEGLCLFLGTVLFLYKVILEDFPIRLY